MTQSELNKLKADLQSLNVEALSEIELLSTPTKFKCLKDGYEWVTEPRYILNHRSACQHCKTAKINENVEEELSYLNINVLTPYKNSTTKLQLQCANESCQHTWLVSPTNLPSVKGCPECRKSSSHHKTSKLGIANAPYLATIETKEQFIGAATAKHGYKYNYSTTNYYKGTKTVSVVCKLGNHKTPQFTIRTDKFLGGYGCPDCAKKSGGLELALPATFYLIISTDFVLFGTSNNFEATYKRLEKLLTVNDIHITGKKCYALSGVLAKRLENKVLRDFGEYKVFDPSMQYTNKTTSGFEPVWKSGRKANLTALRQKRIPELVKLCDDFMDIKGTK